jgi:signal transduction histidine kinase
MSSPATRSSGAVASLTGEHPSLAEETQRLREQLQRSEARFRDVIDRNADAIVVVDANGVVRFANRMATRFFKGLGHELVGSAFGFPIVAEETTEVDLVSDETPRVAEMRVVESEWEGETAYIASLRDITDRRAGEQHVLQLVREQAARSAAEELARRLQYQLESTATLAASLDQTAILSALPAICVPEIADWAVLYAVDGTGVVRRLEVAHRDPGKRALLQELQNSSIDPHTPHPVLDAFRTRKPILASTFGEGSLVPLALSERQATIARELGVASLMVVPMVARDRALGAIALVSSNPDRRFGDQDLALAQDIATRGALALDNARLYEEARKANQTKTDFLAIVSHDLRTPLNAIIGYAELLLMGIPEPVPEAAGERVRRVQTSARHLLYLLDELLDFARLDSGKEHVHVQEVDVTQVAREVKVVMEPLVTRRGLLFELALSSNPLPLRTDPDKLRQVLLNLVGNAVKYTERGVVRVAVTEGPDHSAIIRVSDTGVGIAEQHLTQIFEPFWQVDETQRQREGGTGLGLSVVQRLVGLLGGEVSVESELGRGTTFTVVLRDANPTSQ